MMFLPKKIWKDKEGEVLGFTLLSLSWHEEIQICAPLLQLIVEVRRMSKLFEKIQRKGNLIFIGE